MADDQVQEPMILVKKPDGTSVRVPLSSLQKEKSQEKKEDQIVGIDTTTLQHNNTTAQQAVSVVVVQPTTLEHADQKLLSAEPPQTLLEESYVEDIPEKYDPIVSSVEKIDTPVVETPAAVTLSVLPSPVHNIRQSWSVDDHTSPLTETVEGVHEVSSIRGDDQILSFLEKSPIHISAELRGRAIALLSSYVKGVRVRDQVIQYAIKSKETGGLALGDVDAQALVQSAETYFHLRTDARRGQTMSTIRSVSDTVVVSPPPVQTVKVEQAMPLPEQPFVSRPTIHDIIAPTVVQTHVESIASYTEKEATQPVGPVEEMKTFTRDDFRRLQTDPNKAVDTLLLQLEHMVQESPLLGLEMRRAWFGSPLYHEYLDMLTQSLGGGFSLSELSQRADGGVLRVDEMVALMRVSRVCEEV